MQQPGSHWGIKVALEMLINMNLCPDGFYLVYGHEEPASATGLGYESLGCYSKDLCRKLCVKKLESFPAVRTLGVDVTAWLLLECSHAATSGSCGSDDVMVSAVLRLIMPFREWQKGREETQ